MFNRSASDLGDAPRDLAALGSALGTAADRLARELGRNSLQRTAGQSRAGYLRARLPLPNFARPRPHRLALLRRPQSLVTATRSIDRRFTQQEVRLGEPLPDVRGVRARVRRVVAAIRARLRALRLRLSLSRVRRCLGGLQR